ncbi:dehydrogenase [Taibaiella sp. KBW10]|uniref:dGTP triphosphohydrolase n=1 Tax=Taibaiella sp. KBW10 TaxID=2153357 RepID=UPI000F5940CC|nr:dNTP triphosphohydrolase [Taibaiella sp. KBW10]RQO30595.1 dehydrogenase [Taibaiella sp. KBW10]
MHWSHLYSDVRPNDTEAKTPNTDTLRTSFMRDYDRIIFSSAFRRLQNKTQVFPLPGPAFVHNRLTHSLEVASVGRTLGKAVGKAIAEKNEAETPAFKEFYTYELASVISAACLAHDIGNPPFGHSGEDAIRHYFTSLDADTKKHLQDSMTANQWADFTHFEGNSNAFRILTHNFNEVSSPYNITQTTLAAIVKYPATSEMGFDKTTGLISTKKSGFFDSEQETWKSIAKQLGLFPVDAAETIYVRHPFVFLTEAADDICYRIIDMEDAHRLGIVSYEQIIALFLPFFDNEEAYHTRDKVMHKLDQIIDPNQKIQYLRAVWIGRMIELSKAAFLENESLLLAGQLQQSLLKVLPEQYQPLLQKIDDFSYAQIYNQKNVVEIEIAGFNVIGKLLDLFVSALLEPKNAKSDKVLQLISPQFPIDKDQGSLYRNLQSITDYISGMTDLFAIDLYRKITGITIKEL